MCRFTTRDVLWLTVVVAMGAAWQLADRERDTVNVRNAELERHNKHLLDLVDRVWANADQRRAAKSVRA
jgi:hypothetical protein